MDMDTFSWEQLQNLARQQGLDAIGISDTDLSPQADGLQQWLQAGWHGEMDYMMRNAQLRVSPGSLVDGCIRVITVRMNYLSTTGQWQDDAWRDIHDEATGYISLYARGRDYHKVLKQRLQKLATTLCEKIAPMGFRVFVDSAPVLEIALAEKSGLGWRGKHTLLLNRDAGSMFFLGEILTDYPFPTSAATTAHCGQCTACLDVCPTQAIVAPYRLDARRCISYLTIEHKGSIPLEFRPAIGNRIYGCDDCQLVCPWNKYAQASSEADFKPRSAQTPASLPALMAWTEADFLKNTEGSAIRRIGHERWQRNVAVALGNGPASSEAKACLHQAKSQASPLLAEHIDWALQALENKQTEQG